MAAIAVLIYHFSLQYAAINGGVLNTFYKLFNLIGYAGVDFFFVISGYIMWITTRSKAVDKPVAQFAYKRLTRIYLGYWPYFLLAIVLINLFPHITPPNANLVGSFWLTEPHTHKLLIQVAWTLQYELYFYFLFAWMLFLSAQKQIWLVAGFCVVIIGYHLFNPAITNTEFSAINFALSPFCLEFFAGCFLGYFFEKRRVTLTWTWALGLVALVYAAYYQSSILKHSLIDNSYIIHRVIIFGSAATLIMASLIEMEKRGIQLFKNMSTLLGGASYSIYLSHTIAIAVVALLGWQNWVQQNSQSPGWWIALFMLLTIIYSVIHYLWIEKPIMSAASKLKKKIFA